MANQWYRTTYCRSDHWRAFSREQLHARPFCEVCHAAKAVELHHWHYRDAGVSILGREKPSDVIAICRPCHELAEARKRRYGVAKVYGRRAGKAVWKEAQAIGKEIRQSIFG
jgi:hypothetical protein